MLVDATEALGAPRMTSPDPSPRMFSAAGDRGAELAAVPYVAVFTNVTMLRPG